MNLLSVFQKKNSGEIARSRLKILLASDKLNCSPEIMEMIKDDMIHMISKYMDIDPGGVELEITHNIINGCSDTIPCLCANIPIQAIPYKRTF